MPVVTGWQSYLPLCTPADVRGRLLTPEATLQLSAAPDFPIGVTVASSVFTSGIEHGLQDWIAIQFQTTGNLPTPLVANTTYYVRDASTATTFKVATVIGGAAIAITSAGTGTVTFRNWALNDVLEAKIVLAGTYIYDSLLTLVMNHIRPWSLSQFYAYFPVNGYGNVTRTPRDRAVIVLNNLINPEDLVWAAVDTTIWLMTQDGTNRNQIDPNGSVYDKGPARTNAAQKAADLSIEAQARLLMVDTANGAYGLFNFDTVTDSVTVSLL